MVPRNRGQYDYVPEASKCQPGTLLVPDRPTATQNMKSLDPFAFVDHIPFNHCCGEDQASYNEAKMIPKRSRTAWAECFGEVCDELVTMTNSNRVDTHPDTPYELAMERRVKIFYLFLFLMLRKPPDRNKKYSMNQVI